MNSHRLLSETRFLITSPLLFMVAMAAWVPVAPGAQAATNVVLWDSRSPLPNASQLANRADWKQVPTDLLKLETDPPKASSDPGYYGRDYSFQGDAVVENSAFTAVFFSATGQMALFPKSSTASEQGGSKPPPLDKPALELSPLPTGVHAWTIRQVSLVRNGGDQVVVEVAFRGGSTDASALFSFDRSGAIEVKPASDMKGVSVAGALSYGIVPSLGADDLIINPNSYPTEKNLAVPSEQSFLALVEGGDSEWFLTWPKGNQRLTATLGNNPAGRIIQSVEFNNDGKSFYIAPLAAPRIWHRESLTAAYLEKDKPSEWERPFSAKWKTQLSEEGVKASFAFRHSKGQIWRGVPGSYQYPVWFDGNTAMFHLSKKVPPKGEALVYFLEGDDTPSSVTTPVEILRETLGRAAAEPILDVTGRKLRTHHRRGGEGVRRACTCGCTEAIQAIFEAGEEVQRAKDISEEVEDMLFFVKRHVERIQEYQRFAGETIKHLQAQATASPELKPFADGLVETAQQILREFDVQKENMKSLDYADSLARQTRSLAAKKAPENLKIYMKQLDAWRAMGGAQDYVVAQCHTLTRKLFQEAGSGCLTEPKAVTLAEQVRARCREVLRNPDGYEIWADY